MKLILLAAMFFALGFLTVLLYLLMQLHAAAREELAALHDAEPEPLSAPSPSGTPENSPAFQRRVNPTATLSPSGTAEPHFLS